MQRIPHHPPTPGPPWTSSALTCCERGAQDDPDTATEPEPLEEAHHRSLAELAGLSPPEPGPDTWLPAVPPPPAAVAYEPPVDTVVTSMPEPGREPEPDPVREQVSQPAARLEPIEEPVALPVVTEPAAEEYDEPGRCGRPSLPPAAAESTTSPRLAARLVTQPAAEEYDEPADLQPAVTEPPEGEFDEPEPAPVEETEPVEAIEETTPVAAVDESTQDLAEEAPAPGRARCRGWPRHRAPTLARAPEHRAGGHPVVA